MFKLLIIVLIIYFVVIGGAEAKNVEQQTSSGKCPVYCMCGCESETNGDPICLPCLSEWTNDGGNDHRVRQTFTEDCFTQTRAASFLNPGQLIGLLLAAIGRILANPILQTVLGIDNDNNFKDAVIPLGNNLCYIVGLQLLVLRSLGLSGILGMEDLLGNILTDGEIEMS